MAISKLILNGEVQMDVTSNTNTAANMLSGVIGTKNDGTSVTGNIATKSAANLTASGSTVTAPAGYYSTAASKSVAAGSAFPPAVTITKAPTFSMNSSTGVITASYAGSSSITPTVNAGYVTTGTAGTISTSGTSTYQLPTDPCGVMYPSVNDREIAPYYWATGTLALKSVTTSNLTAANIANGVTVKVGDANNASRITQVTGTYNPSWYSEYKALVLNTQSISNSLYSFSAFLNTLTTVEKYMFTGVQFTTDTYNFNNVTTVDDYGLAGIRPFWNTYTVSFNFPKVTQIKSAGFYARKRMVNINCPVCVSIATSAFYSCQHLETINFPICETIEYDAFVSCIALTSAIFPSCTTLGTSVFYGCTELATVSFPKCTTVGAYTFTLCTKLVSVDFPSCSRIGTAGFWTCTSLQTANFPNCSSIETYGFSACTRLMSISFPTCQFIGPYAFHNCYSLTSAIFPSCTIISNYAFYACSALSSISFPNCETIGNAVFYCCSSIITANFPKCTSVGNNAFSYCAGLTTISLPICAYIGSSAFRACYNLISLYLNSVSAVPTLASSATFASTPIGGYSTSAGRYGSIFVPASLYNSFKTATNWSTYSSRFVSV